VLKFKIDEEELAADKRCNPSEACMAMLKNTYFIMPVKLQINDIELFKISSDNPWLDYPIIHIATFGLSYVLDLKNTKNFTYEMPEGGYLKFKKTNNHVLVSSLYHKTPVSVSYDELVAAFEKFSEDVRKFLIKNFPEMKQHPELGEWLTHYKKAP